MFWVLGLLVIFLTMIFCTAFFCPREHFRELNCRLLAGVAVDYWLVWLGRQLSEVLVVSVLVSRLLT